MRSPLPDFVMKTPASLTEALQLLLTSPGEWQAFGGGTDLMVLLEAGQLTHRKFLNIWHLPELKGIQVSKDFVSIGAMATYSEILEQEILAKEFPMLGTAAHLTGSAAIQNRGTLAGNIVNASPAADSPPALLAYEAQIELISVKGSRWVPYCQFHQGYKKIDRREEELVKTIRLPRTPHGGKQYYRKVGARKEQAISKVCLAAIAFLKDRQIETVRIGVGSVAPIPLRCFQTEAVLRGKVLTQKTIAEAEAAIALEIAPIDDLRSTRHYRQRVTQNLLGEFLCGIGLDN